MSRLEELIQQLCPNGVQFVHIGRVVTYLPSQNDFSTLLSKIRKRRKKQEGPARD